MSVVTIDSVWLNQIKKIIAAPMVDSLLLSDEEIKDLIIFPVLQKYFTKFPIKEELQMSINGEMFIPFPDEYTFGVLDCRVVDIGLLPGSGTGFWDLVLFTNTNSMSSSMKGSGAYGYNPSGLLYQRDVERQQYKSQQNQYTTIKSRVDITNKRLIVYSSMTGSLNITWAKYSNNFDSVMFERRDDVIKLCQAELLDHLIDAASILSDSGLEISINIDKLGERSEKLKEYVKERWDAVQEIIFLHSV
jgi:hypothetical protein